MNVAVLCCSCGNVMGDGKMLSKLSARNSAVPARSRAILLRVCPASLERIL